MENNQNNERKYLGIMFECCHVYGRIYKSKDGTCYRGMCPKCMKSIKIPIGEGGTGERFFTSY